MVLDEEAQAHVDVWNYALGIIHPRVVKCAVDLQIPDILEKHGGPMSLSDISSAVKCPSDAIYRIMRFLTFHKIFNKINQTHDYAQTPLSRLFARDKMAPVMLLHGNPPARSSGITAEALRSPKRADLGHGDVIETTEYFKTRGDVFTNAMACHARVIVSSIIDNYPEASNGVESLVDVGGRDGRALGMLVQAFPAVHGINFDLPQVVADAPPRDGVVHVGGDKFESVPRADAAMLMRVLHDWSDEACIDILKKCKDAVPIETGKVLIIDAVIHDEDDEVGDAFAGVRLAMDMMMMAVTAKGKERTNKEWVHLLSSAGFSRHTVINIHAIEFVIEAFPRYICLSLYVLGDF